jgi:hypothetical protein
MIIPIQTEVLCFSDYYDEAPSHARIDLNDKSIAWIKKMHRLVNRNDIAYLADYNCDPKYVKIEEDESDTTAQPLEFRVECEMIVVRKGGFYYKGIVKHSDPSIHYETESISIEWLNKLIRFATRTPLSKMPKYINDEDYSIREIALRAMKGEQGI